MPASCSRFSSHLSLLYSTIYHHRPPRSPSAFVLFIFSMRSCFGIQKKINYYLLCNSKFFFFFWWALINSAGPKEWLKEQKKKSSKYLLAPIDASRNSLNAAYLVLTKGESEYKENDWEKVKNLVNSAARDCVAEERNSFVAFQAKTGVEVCTFRLIVKNAASLLDDKDPIKLEAEAKLADLVRSFASLNDLASEINVQVASSRERVTNALMDTLFSLNNFEKGIKNCLEI